MFQFRAISQTARLSRLNWNQTPSCRCVSCLWAITAITHRPTSVWHRVVSWRVNSLMGCWSPDRLEASHLGLASASAWKSSYTSLEIDCGRVQPKGQQKILPCSLSAGSIVVSLNSAHLFRFDTAARGKLERVIILRVNGVQISWNN